MIPGGLHHVLLAGRRAVLLTISVDTSNYNLYNAAISAGWNGLEALDLTCTINSGIYVNSTSTSTPGFETGAFPATAVVNVINNGFIVGKGGNGGQGGNGSTFDRNGAVGTAGGPAFKSSSTSSSIRVTNNGTIGGGGGGGAGGNSAFYVHFTGYPSSVSGGGGGGGASLGSGAAAGPNCPAPACPAAGTNATLSTNGVGGAGGGPDNFYGNNSMAGANGGGLGVAGSSSVNNGSGTPVGGAAGPAIQGNANITFLVNGTRLGAIT